MIFKQEQLGELFLVEFFHTTRDVMLEDKIEEGLLLDVEPGVDVNFCIRSPDFTCDHRQGIGYMGEHVKEIALPGINMLGSGFGFVHA